MDKTEKYIDLLKELVEKRIGRKIYGHSDFTGLAERVYQENKNMISPTTLKRIWGYLKEETPTPQKRTLNVLAEFIGFKNWQDFYEYQDNQNDYSSEFIKRHTQHSFLMETGKEIRISWYPNRNVVLRHEGDGDLFTVVSSENSKLEAGMTVHCETFTIREMLLLKNVKGKNIMEPCDYICGKIGGIEYELIER